MKENKEAIVNAVLAEDVPPRALASNYPETFASRMKGRTKRQLGDVFDIKKFGVNLTELAPGAESSLYHKHSKQEEFIYILLGRPTLRTQNEEIELEPGMCAGFIPSGGAHQLVNRSKDKVVYLEIGDREAGDEGSYPEDDLVAKKSTEGPWVFTKKNGEPY